MFKRCFNVMILLFLLCQLAGFFNSVAFASPGPPPQFLDLPGVTELESDISQWYIFHDQGYTKGTVASIDKAGDKALEVTLSHGTQDYANILAFRNLPPADSATLFSMDVSFMYQKTVPMQALEFTMDKWVNNVRWEWALQWQVVPDGTVLGVPPMTWRAWNGSSWQSIQVTQNLLINQWHTLHLYGEIVNNQVHYVGFTCDTVYTDLSQLTFNPAPSSGDKTGVAVQLDGNYSEAAYTAFYRDINLNYR